MSDDIVARLRQSHRIGCECFGCEAADEIERLRDEMCLANIDKLNIVDEEEQLSTEIVKLRAEIVKLRDALDAARIEVCLVRAPSTTASDDIDNAMRKYAKTRGWDCFRGMGDES